jgi:zinc protease
MRRAARLSIFFRGLQVQPAPVVVLAASLALSGFSVPVAAQANGAANPAQQALPPGVKLVDKMPDAAPPRPFTFPTPVSKTLPNGLRVFVVSARARGANVPVDPAVSVELLIRNAGSGRDPQDKPGLAAFTGDLLRQGTEKRTAQEIAAAIDFVGGSLSAGAGRDSTTLGVTVVKKDFELGMDLLSDITLHAKFAPDEIARRRQRALSGFRSRYEDADYLASSVFRRVVFGAGSYGMPPDGTPESVNAITREDLVAFRDQYYAPNESIMAFAGDITPEEAFAAAEKYFGSWAKKDAAPPRIVLPEQPGGLRILVIDMPDAVQTQIRVGRQGIPRNHPDFLPLTVTNYIFGGGFNSRLNVETRVNRGLTYGAGSDFTGALYAGDFVADTYTRTEATVETAKVLLDEIRKMAGGEVTANELNVARDYLSGVFVIATETPNQVAARVTNAAFYGLPDDYNQTYPAKVRATTSEQVKQMAARYFDANNENVVLVGNAAAFRDALKAAFPAAKYEEIDADDVDLMAPDLRKAAPAAVRLATAPDFADRTR